MRISLVVLITLGIFTFSAGCGRKVKRIEVEEQHDLSGKWNDTDSRIVSEEMIKDSLERPWSTEFLQKNGQKPKVIVGTMLNKTDEHIISETFTKDLEKAFINSGKVDLVASSTERMEIRAERIDMQENSSQKTKKEMKNETAADFMLKGVVNSIRDKYRKKQIMYYQIDLELINTETNQKVWIGDKKIKKFIKR
ncbi:penicillin-binding protein activator LpoB [Elusimicrobiota bacterium]